MVEKRDHGAQIWKLLLHKDAFKDSLTWSWLLDAESTRHLILTENIWDVRDKLIVLFSHRALKWLAHVPSGNYYNRKDQISLLNSSSGDYLLDSSWLYILLDLMDIVKLNDSLPYQVDHWRRCRKTCLLGCVQIGPPDELCCMPLPAIFSCLSIVHIWVCCEWKQTARQTQKQLGNTDKADISENTSWCIYSVQYRFTAVFLFIWQIYKNNMNIKVMFNLLFYIVFYF